jgi:D-xylose transport system permease protein
MNATDATVSPANEPVTRSWLEILRPTDSSVLPVLLGLFLISIIFQSLDSHFLTAGNLVNLLVQGAVFMMLAMGEVFVLILGEIDLSAGFVAGICGTVVGKLVKDQTGWPWWAAVAFGLLCCAAIGLLQGTIISRLGLPSFIVTLAGLLAWQGVMLWTLGTGEGLVPINDKMIVNVANGNLSPAAGWIVALALIAVVAVVVVRHRRRRVVAGLVAPSANITMAKIAGTAALAVVLVTICNTERGTLLSSIRGVPWVVLLVLAVLGAWSWLLARTATGRYLYAIGGNTEAARRAGIVVPRIRTMAFMLSSFTAGIAGIIYASTVVASCCIRWQPRLSAEAACSAAAAKLAMV